MTSQQDGRTGERVDTRQQLDAKFTFPGHKDITWPIISGVILAVILALFAWLYHKRFDIVDGCNDTVRGRVKLAELKISEGEFDKAISISQEALILSSGCRCAHSTLSRGYFYKMIESRKLGLMKLETYYALQCFKETRASISFIYYPDPEIEARLKACSVDEV